MTREELYELLNADLADQFDHCDVDDVILAYGGDLLGDLIDEWRIYSAIQRVFRRMMATWDVAQKRLIEQINELFDASNR